MSEKLNETRREYESKSREKEALFINLKKQTLEEISAWEKKFMNTCYPEINDFLYILYIIIKKENEEDEETTFTKIAFRFEYIQKAIENISKFIEEEKEREEKNE